MMNVPDSKPHNNGCFLRLTGVSLLLCLLLSACGFHLQSQQSLPPQLKALYFKDNTPYHALNRQLKNTLRHLNTTLVCQPNQAPFTLEILSIHENTQEIGNTLNNSISTRAYLLTSYLTFTITRADGSEVVAPLTVNASRHFVLPGNVLLDNSDEQNIAKTALQQTLIDLLLDRLSSNQVRMQLANAPPLTTKTPTTTITPTAIATATTHENQRSTA